MGALASIIPMIGKHRGGTGLPPYTLRFKANRAVTLSDFPAKPITLTLVDDATHTYDVKLEQNDWSMLFLQSSDPPLNDWLTEVVDANTRGVTNMSGMFLYCISLTSVPLFDTSSVTDMSAMFVDCISLTSVPLFDTSSVTNMSAMFGECISLTSVPLFDTRNVADMSGMLAGCESIDSVPLFDTSSVTNMSNAFYGCKSVERGALDLYQQASTQAIPPASHSDVFTFCGAGTETGLAELQQIPISWGGQA